MWNNHAIHVIRIAGLGPALIVRFSFLNPIRPSPSLYADGRGTLENSCAGTNVESESPSILLHAIPRGHASCCSTGLHAPFPVAQPDFDWTARSCPMSTGMALCPVEGRMKATGISTQRATVATPYAFHLEIGKTRTLPHFSYRLEPAVRLNQMIPYDRWPFDL